MFPARHNLMHRRGFSLLAGRFAASTALCALAACGTTVDLAAVDRGGAEPGADATTGLVGSGATGGELSVSPGSGPSVARPGQSGMSGATGGGSSGATVAPSATSGTMGEPGLPAALAGRGFTKGTIMIGVATADDANAYAKTLGFDHLDAGDSMAQYNAVVGDINRRGGIAGRKIVLVKHDFNTAETLNDPETANEAACATWTQDHQVFAVIIPGFIVTDNLLGCLKRTDTPLVFGGGIEAKRIYRQTYERYPNFFNPGAILGDRYDELVIRRLVARGFFKGWDSFAGRPGTAPMKLGAIFGDGLAGDIKKKSFERQLARHGITFSSVVRCPTTISAGISCSQSAVLRMQADRITHMMGVGVFFLATAEGQHYRPRYWIDQTARSFSAVAPHAQLAGAMAESILPLMDVEQEQDPGDPSAATGYCRRVMRASGQDTSDRTTMWSMGSTCDSFYFFQAAVQAGGALSTAGVRRGFESLGSAVPSALTWSSFFGPGERASTRGVRDLKFVPETCEGCNDGHFAYVDKVTHVAH